MAKNITVHVANMDEANIPMGTAQYLQVRDPRGAIDQYAEWVSFDADNAAWRLANPGQADPKVCPHAAAVDPENPTMGEKLFIQSRFIATYSTGEKKTEPAQWAQINSTNFPTMDIAAYKTAAKNMYDAQRAFEDLVPV